MRIAICEDEEHAQKRLKKIICDWATVKKISTDISHFPSAEAFLMIWPETQFDLVFLDIQMKQMTGIELAALICKSDANMLIVFVTNHRQYAINGYDVNAFHYLIKPISPAKLLPILDKAYMIWHSNHEGSILISTDSAQIKLIFSDIFYISKNGNMATVNIGGKSYETRKALSEFAAILPSNFLRCHRSFIVNLYKIDSLYKSALTLSNGDTLPVSRDNAKVISDAYVRLHLRNTV